ncbi:MAG: hypothetical protein PW788_03360 [Micavibrio sp.]|nr:hypothetical protein [Micavibrio sp.]
MQIIEQFTQGKAGTNDLNEDRIAIGPNFIAVLDGATSRAGHTLRGLSNGMFAAKVVGDALEHLPKDIDARAAIDSLTATLLAETRAAAKEEGRELTEVWSFPAAALLVYSVARREIWRVADSTFVIDGRANCKTFPQERTWCELRRAYLCAELARGKNEEQLRDHDPTWDVLTPLIANFKVFANYDGPYGYGVINGSTIPDVHVEVYPAAHATEIIFASDGYPEVESTHAATEKYLLQLVKDDPLMYNLQPQVKGVKRGHVSFDDRTYLRFKPV